MAITPRDRRRLSLSMQANPNMFTRNDMRVPSYERDLFPFLRCANPATPHDACNACGEQARKLVAVTDGVELHLVAEEHADCMANASRLGYTRTPGKPGMFPQVCAGCAWRDQGAGRYCTNPDRAEAGGMGLVAKRAGEAVVACSGRRSQ